MSSRCVEGSHSPSSGESMPSRACKRTRTLLLLEGPCPPVYLVWYSTKGFMMVPKGSSGHLGALLGC